MIAPEKHASVLALVDRSLEEAESVEEAAREAMHILYDNLPTYKWVGIYWLADDELRLGPYVGADTDHVRIPVGRGVCGAAVSENRNRIVENVRELGNYLACSLETRSEIVVLIRDEMGRILGQIDADGHNFGDFDDSDERLLEVIGQRLAVFMEARR